MGARRRIVAAVLGGLAVLVLLVVLVVGPFGGGGEGDEVAAPVGGADERVSDGAPSASGDGAGEGRRAASVRDVAAAIGEGSVGRGPSGTLPEFDELVGTVSETLRGLVSEEASGFLAMLRSQGIEPNERTTTEGFAEEYWPMVRRVFSDARFDLGSVEIRDVFAQGAYEEEVGVGFAAQNARRNVGRAFLSRWDERELEKAEAVLPGRFETGEGRAFDGTLVLVFALNPEDERWVLIEYRLYGVPTDALVVTPPL